MSDVLTPSQRSYCMSRNRGRDTQPEVRLRKALWKLGFRYRLGSRLPGKPDIVLPTKRTAIFIDGCFWHGCPEHFKFPTTNAAFWIAKVGKTRARDRKANDALAAAGWRVIRIWEHEIRAGVGDCAANLKEALSASEAI